MAKQFKFKHLPLVGITALFTAHFANADQVIADDLIVQGSNCVGTDCINNENFGFATLRLKENNTRIEFDDTSASGSFPANDWMIVANDSASGGSSYLGFQDETANKYPFKVMAGSSDNALIVNGKKVGFNTASPALPLHEVYGDSPGLRLEQDGSSGWSSQTWDIVGNEANFFIRDVTNSSKLPFRIKPGAPTNSISIDSSGNVGMGIQTASANLHIKSNEGTTASRDLLRLTNNGNPEIVLENTAFNTWRISGGLNLVVKNTANTSIFKLDSNGNLTINGTIKTAGTTCSGGCDLTFKEADTRVPSIADHAKQMWAEGFLPGVGPTKENAEINISEKTGAMLHELEVAHIYIDQLNKEIKAKDSLLQSLLERVESLEAKSNAK